MNIQTSLLLILTMAILVELILSKVFYSRSIKGKIALYELRTKEIEYRIGKPKTSYIAFGVICIASGVLAWMSFLIDQSYTGFFVFVMCAIVTMNLRLQLGSLETVQLIKNKEKASNSSLIEETA